MICHDCGVEEGEIHQLGCDMEKCPFCGGQLISCDCCNDEKEFEEFFKKVFEKGRIPYIQWPVICARCGELYPEFFSVTDEEWEKYVELDMRDVVLCRDCWDWIKGVTDKYQKSEKNRSEN